jgi:hypothetical protein
MAIRTREQLKTKFETGDKPTEQDFVDLLDSALIRSQDEITVTDGAITFAKLATSLTDGDIADASATELTTNAKLVAYLNGRGFALDSALTTAIANAVLKAGDTMAGPLNLSGDPSADAHAARKKYVDDSIATVNAAISTAVAGLNWKTAARAVITGSEATIDTYLTADGVTLAAGDRVVRNSGSSPQNNGIYVVSAGSWSRATDANTGAKMSQATVAIMEGTSFGDKILMCSNNGTITIGSTNVTWVTIGQATSYSAGAGLSLSGTVFSVDSTVQLRTTTVATQSGSAISFDSPRQDLTTSSGGSGTAISITSFTNTGIGKRVLWLITSQHASDTLSVSVSGATILNQGFSFVPNVVNLVYLTHIGTNLYTLTISPNV